MSKTMLKQVILRFPVELPEKVLQDKEVLKKAKETMVLELLRKGEISQGKAAELLEISRHELFDLMTKYDVSVMEMTEEELKEELERQLKFPIHSVKAGSFLKHAGLVSINYENKY